MNQTQKLLSKHMADPSGRCTAVDDTDCVCITSSMLMTGQHVLDGRRLADVGCELPCEKCRVTIIHEEVISALQS